MGMRVLGGANVVHLVDAAALRAALNRAVLADGEPDGDVRIGRAAGAAEVALLAERRDGDRVVKGTCE